MITPNKFTPFDQSVLRKLEVILARETDDVDISTLFEETSTILGDINQFMYALDVLFILDCIEIDFKTRTLTYVDRDSM